MEMCKRYSKSWLPPAITRNRNNMKNPYRQQVNNNNNNSNNNNNNNSLQLDCCPVAVVILHVYKIWNWLLLNLSREG